jgi:hypothetical protein
MALICEQIVLQQNKRKEQLISSELKLARIFKSRTAKKVFLNLHSQ